MAAVSHPPAFSTHDEAPAPSYQTEGDIWTHWAAADRASRRVNEIQAKLAEVEPDLRIYVKELERLKEKSSKLFESLHDKSRFNVSNALKRISSGSSAQSRESKNIARQDFELAHREETSMMMKIEKMRETVSGLTKQLDNNTRLASETDQVFELLGASVAALNINSTELVTTAEHNLATASTAYEMGQKLVTDLLRARVTVQHAHHYYHTVLKTIDAVRGTALGRFAIGGMGEMSKNRDYQVAVDTASKAQVCFNETVRVLTPRAAVIPSEVMADFEKLKELGLLQASKIYGLMYGWKSSTAGIGKSVKLMLDKQETAFACLTRFAVWVQNKVPVAESELSAARASRDHARRELVAAWKAQIDSTSNLYSVTPSR